jgi:catechol 2,3-dioxygenase-like lactoylglutathione lyase family enzyme
MSLTLGSTVLNVSDIRRATEFWRGALGYIAQDDNPAFLAPPDGQGPRLHLDETDRTHLDLWVDRTSSDLAKEVTRLISLGASRVAWAYPEGAGFVVLADPDGNLFCVVA